MQSLSLTVLFTASVLLGLATAQNATALGPIPTSVDGAEKGMAPDHFLALLV